MFYIESTTILLKLNFTLSDYDRHAMFFNLVGIVSINSTLGVLGTQNKYRHTDSTAYISLFLLGECNG